MSIAAPSNPKEITLRGIILGILITLIFTAAQVYLGLKVGLTFATSIPAAVISMALLSAFKDATIQENNIVQTIASAAGTLASVIFVLPGLLMIGWWAHVPFWPTFGACAIGGVLGVIAALNVSELVGWMERVTGQHIFSSDVYFVSNLPSELQGGDVVLICTAGFVLSFLATLYPAYRAAKIEPAHALRYS
ncbi:MAG TPA: hypothetical protein DIW86_08355 [Pseudomonas sp.]|nr:hypothetical protein [Pseudomonas sp.]